MDPVDLAGRGLRPGKDQALFDGSEEEAFDERLLAHAGNGSGRSRWFADAAARRNDATFFRQPAAIRRCPPSSRLLARRQAQRRRIRAGGKRVTDRFEVFLQSLEGARAVRGVALMGVCNVTPDSFSDGGLHFTQAAARARVDELIAHGADFIDIGGESPRPGAAPVAAGVQSERVLDAVRYAASRGACVSIDTADS